MTEQITISSLGQRGDGIAETPAGPLYVSYTLPGEAVTAEAAAGHPDRRQLLHIDHPSAERVPAPCKHFGTCGGCALQHWSLAEYRLWKRNLVVEMLERHGLVCPVLAPELSGARKAAWAIAEALKVTQKPLDIHITAADNGLDVDVRGSGPLKPAEITALARIADVHGLVRLARHGELVTQRAQPLLTVGRAQVPQPPGTVVQAPAEGGASQTTH